MTKFEECIIHIGTSKTATTTLQWFFERNRSILSKNGILYPESFGEKVHYNLAAALCNVKRANGRRRALGITQPHQIERFKDEILNSFRKEIQNEKCTKLLISSETLYLGMASIEEIKSLKKFLDEFVNKYKIIVYIRPQHEHQISGFSTRCLSGGTDKKILQDREQTKSLLDYEKKIGKWAIVFNDENIYPKIFAKKEFPDGNIKKDFVLFLGLNWNEFEDAEDRNKALSGDAQRFLLGINKFLPKFIDNKLNPNYVGMQRVIKSTQNGKGLVPSRKECEDYFKIFIESNERLRKKWFPERKELFEVDFTKYPEQVQRHSEIDSSFFKIFAELWISQERKISKLQKELKSK